MRIRRILVAVFFVCTTTAFAQTNKGGISGTVFDPTGAALADATVVVTNVGTNQEIRVQTSRSGAYSTPPLEPVTYRVTVTVPGFQKSVIENVKVNTATVAKVDVRLKTGAITETVSVVARAPLVNAESGTAGQTITQHQIVEMPLNNRSVLDLAQTVANVSGIVGTEDPELNPSGTEIPAPGYNLFINGGRAGTTAILADGAWNTGVGLGRAVVTFSPDTIQEFTVHTSNFSAEYGQTGSGVINMTTKSGTNKLDGLLYWYHRNPKFNAAPYSVMTINRPQANRRQHQFGVTLGGAVVLPKLYNGHDKTFFYVAYEPRYYYDSNPANSLFPTAAMRQGDFSNVVQQTGTGNYLPLDVAQRLGIQYTPVTIYNQFDTVVVNGKTQFVRKTLAAGQTYPVFPNNRIPANMLDPISQEVLKHLPEASDQWFLDSDGGPRNYAGSSFIRNLEQRLTVRIDQQFGSRNHLSLRYTQVPIRADRGSNNFVVGRDEVNTSGTEYSSSRQILMTNTHMFSSSVVNDLRLNYTFGRFGRDYPPQYDYRTGENFSRELGLPTVTPGGLPQFNTGMGYVGWSLSTQGENEERQYNIADSLSIVTGNMSWKVGVDLLQQEMMTIPTFVAGGGRYAFDAPLSNSRGLTSGDTGGMNFANFLMGLHNAADFRDTLIEYNYQWRSVAGFIQNDWKVSPSLTLNLGLRYSLQLPRTEKNNLQGTFLLEQAREYPLAKAVVLPNGQRVTTALVPPFAYSGRGGRSRYLTPIDWRGWEPRFGFAWVPPFGWNQTNRLVIRGGYGMSHTPLTGMGRNASPDFGAFGTSRWNTGQTDPNYVGRLSTNPPLLIQKTPEQKLAIPEDGMVWLGSINNRAVAPAISPDTRVPYIQSWSASVSYELPLKTAIEVSYLGSKGTHLFLPAMNPNPVPFDLAEAYFGAGLNVADDTDDPLGRVDANNRVVRFSQGFLGAKYLGFEGLNVNLNSAGNSRRNAVTASLRRQHANGFSFTINYTYGKGMDDASDSGGVRFVDYYVVRSPGHSTLGAPRSQDWSVSMYDIKHVLSGSFMIDLPFGRDRKFFSNAPGLIDGIFGGWGLSAIGRIQGGLPLAVVLRDGNRLADGNIRSIRPNLVPGVPLRNPNWTRDCPVGNAKPCTEPYFNPAAFMRPPKGELGNAPRAFDDARFPATQTLDVALQKNFRLSRNGKARLQLRIDAINVLNHPIFRFGRDSDAGEVFDVPNENMLTTAEFAAWADFKNADGSLFRNIPASERAALKARSDAIVAANRIPGTQTLRADFFSVPVPQDFATAMSWGVVGNVNAPARTRGFATMDANEFDVTTEQGLKLYRLRRAYTADRWGFLGTRSPYSPRFIQFGVKLYF